MTIRSRRFVRVFDGEPGPPRVVESLAWLLAFLLADRAPRMLQEVFEGFIELGPKLYLLRALEKTRLCESRMKQPN
jgi:hypothetical protein